MELIEELKILENTYHKEEDLLISKNNSSVLLVNISNDLLNNTYLKAITRYVAANTSSSYVVNTKDSFVMNKEQLKEKIDEIISELNLKLIINITSTKEESDIIYKVSKSQDYTTTKELEESFTESLITNIKKDETSEESNYDYIEIAINDKYHDLEEPENIEKLCNAIINFIKMYSNFSD